MIRRLVARLPGPPVVRALLAAVAVVAVLALLVVVFELLGRLLDDGGVIG